MEKELIEKLENLIESLGIRHYGYTSFSELEKYNPYFENRPEGYENPFEERPDSGKAEDRLKSPYPGCENIISMAFPYFGSLKLKKNSFSCYTRGNDYHREVLRILESVSGLLRENGFKAYSFTDSNSLPERLIGHEAGIGCSGRNNLLINEEYGSFFFLGEIVTDMKLTPSGNDMKIHEICGECTKCISACPQKILGYEYTDTLKCISFLTQKKDLTDEEILSLRGSLFGCDICQSVCPKNMGREGYGLEAFRPYDYMENPDLHELAVLSKKDFEKYRKTSAGWRGKTILMRNAIIALMREKRDIGNLRINSEKLLDIRERCEKLFKE